MATGTRTTPAAQVISVPPYDPMRLRRSSSLVRAPLVPVNHEPIWIILEEAESVDYIAQVRTGSVEQVEINSDEGGLASSNYGTVWRITHGTLVSFLFPREGLEPEVACTIEWLGDKINVIPSHGVTFVKQGKA